LFSRWGWRLWPLAGENSVELGRYAEMLRPTPQIAQIKLALVQPHEFLGIEPLAVGST
jgi:hypothetical protein